MATENNANESAAPISPRLPVPVRPERAVPGQGVCEGAELLSARVDENGDVLRRPGGRRGDESELVAEIEWVLDDADDGPTPPVEIERRPELHVQELGHTLGEGDLPGPAG